jgi:hypothetical protein
VVFLLDTIVLRMCPERGLIVSDAGREIVLKAVDRAKVEPDGRPVDLRQDLAVDDLGPQPFSIDKDLTSHKWRLEVFSNRTGLA